MLLHHFYIQVVIILKLKLVYITVVLLVKCFFYGSGENGGESHYKSSIRVEQTIQLFKTLENEKVDPIIRKRKALVIQSLRKTREKRRYLHLGTYSKQ